MLVRCSTTWRYSRRGVPPPPLQQHLQGVVPPPTEILDMAEVDELKGRFRHGKPITLRVLLMLKRLPIARLPLPSTEVDIIHVKVTVAIVRRASREAKRRVPDLDSPFQTQWHRGSRSSR